MGEAQSVRGLYMQPTGAMLLPVWPYPLELTSIRPFSLKTPMSLSSLTSLPPLGTLCHLLNATSSYPTYLHLMPTTATGVPVLPFHPLSPCPLLSALYASQFPIASRLCLLLPAPSPIFAYFLSWGSLYSS